MAPEALVGLCAPGGLPQALVPPGGLCCRKLFSSGQVGLLATPRSNSQGFQLGLCSVLAIEMAWAWEELPPRLDWAAYLLYDLE